MKTALLILAFSQAQIFNENLEYVHKTEPMIRAYQYAYEASLCPGTRINTAALYQRMVTKANLIAQYVYGKPNPGQVVEFEKSLVIAEQVGASEIMRNGDLMGNCRRLLGQ